MLWDVATGEPKTALVGHQRYILSLAFSTDGVTLVSGAGDNTVRLWRAATEEEVLTHRK
jgi:WD40 repeat protein